MLLVGVLEVILNLVRVCLGWLYLPDFNLAQTFAPYITWFSHFLDNATSLLCFLIPQPVFTSALLIGIFIHQFDHIVLLTRWVLGLIPFVRKFNPLFFCLVDCSPFRRVLVW